VGRYHDASHRLPVGIELLRDAMLVLLAVLAIDVVLPALLALAATSFP
jgi:hypothetical protein